MLQGKVFELKISEKKGEPKKSLETAVLIKDSGIEGDMKRGPGLRQVSFFTLEGSNKLKNSKLKGLCTEKFWGNINTEGLSLSEIQPGTKLKIGDALIEITEKGKECFKNCELFKSGLNCNIPGETAFGRILRGGMIHVGDEIEIEDEK